MALPVTIPNSFANATSSIPLSQLDTNFNTLSNAVNGINSGAETLANLVATTANVTTGNITTVNATTVDTTNIEVTNIKAKDGTASVSIADSTGDVSFANNVTLGDASGDSVTINAATVSTPNGLNFDSNTFVIDATNNRVGIGTSSPTERLEISGNFKQSNGTQGVQIINTTVPYIQAFTTGGNNPLQINGQDLRFFTGASFGAESERMRIDSSGNLLVGATSWNGGATIGLQINATDNTSGVYAQLIKNSSNAEIFQMRCDGGLGNFSANDANLSDARVKTDIQDAGNYLEKICAIPVRTFKFKDQTDDLLNLGCIAQEVEAIAPELVDVSGFGTTPDDGIPLKAIYQTDLQYALMKCIQELKAELDTVKAELATLKG